MNRHTLDAKSRKLVFIGPCLDVTHECRAMCCREWDVGIVPSEHASGHYDSETFCKVDNSACIEKPDFCMNQQHRLKKRGDGSCVYLNEESMCSIYEKRPGVCRNFSCVNGWRLTSVAQTPGPAGTGHVVPGQGETFAKECTGAAVFIANPLVALKTVFYDDREKEIVLVVKHISKCTVTTIKRTVDAGQLTDERITGLFGFFNGRAGMEALMIKANGLGIDPKVFMELTGLFLSIQLVVPIFAGKQPVNG
jgi:hypothetical protein